MAIDEDDDTKQEILQKLNIHVFNLGFPPFTPKQQEMHNIGYAWKHTTIHTTPFRDSIYI